MAATIFACGGDDGGGGGGGNHADASVATDAKVFMDAPPGGVTGLGQKCASNTDCPASAPDCIALVLGSTNSTKYCTPHCVDDASAMTGSDGQFTAASFNPAPMPAKCTGAYSGTVGTPVCGVLLAYTPMDNPLKKNMAYTMIDLGCAVQCGTGSTCPTGMTCTSNFCFPSP
jgi:hypothetical protein